MSGRRNHTRFTVTPSPQGILRVLRDVVVQSETPQHMVVVSTDPGVLGELVSVQAGYANAGVFARVLESQLIVVDGTVRHQLRLQPAVQSFDAESLQAND
jgi:hypothetical protein